EGAVADRAVLAHQLVEALAGHRTRPARRNVDPRLPARLLAVEGHAETNRLAARRTKDEVQVARVEAERNPGSCGKRAGALRSVDPLPLEAPVVERQRRGRIALR